MITNHYGHCPYRRITATEWRLVAWWHLHTLTVEKGWYCWFKSICIKLCFVLGFFQNTKIENLHCSTASESYAWVKSLVQENSGFHQSSLSLSFSLVLLFLPPPAAVFYRDNNIMITWKRWKQNKRKTGNETESRSDKSSSVNEEIRLDGSPLLSLQAVRSKTNCNRWNLLTTDKLIRMSLSEITISMDLKDEFILIS